MGAKVHKSLRIDNDLIERVEKLKEENEALSNAICRVLYVGCETLECSTAESTAEHDVAQREHDESTRKLIERLEADIERLTAEHEADRAAIADKDKQIAAALEKAHELADQSHVLIGMTQEAKKLPTGEEGGEVLDVTPIPEKISFREWWRKYR